MLKVHLPLPTTLLQRTLHFHLTKFEERDRAAFKDKVVVIADIDESSLEGPGDFYSLHLLGQMLMLDHIKDKLGGLHNLGLGCPLLPH